MKLAISCLFLAAFSFFVQAKDILWWKLYTNLEFNDSKGTKLKEVMNNRSSYYYPVIPSFNRNITTCETDGNGNLRLRKSKLGAEDSWIAVLDDINAISEGTFIAVINIDKWRLTETTNERLTFSFHEDLEDCHKVAAASLERLEDGEIKIIGRSDGVGDNLYESANFPDVNLGSSYIGNINLILYVDLDNNFYGVDIERQNYGETQEYISLGENIIEPFTSIGYFKIEAEGNFADIDPMSPSTNVKFDFLDIESIRIGVPLP